MNRLLRILVVLAIALAVPFVIRSLKSDNKTPVSPEMDSSGFVNLTDVVPDAIIEARYFATYNFVGARVDGYLEPVVLYTREAAEALKAVSDDVKAQGYRLKVYDAYRPQCAVDHFVRWGKDLADSLMKPYFYPDQDKAFLFERGYIAEKSGHTRGSAIDLTLFDMATGKEVDMGGVHDWFGIESHPDYGGNPDTGEYTGGVNLTEEQFRNRMILRQAMVRHGFATYDCEWWHFSLADEPYPDTYFNFPVKTLGK
ncbi:MAG: M15 family metallopeptidase [Bacteroidales bacterium]|jgi:D-alanyl-D-alanine dipeptidase|nr:M15 family metallopeptidase [Bacteroidales bacterium]